MTHAMCHHRRYRSRSEMLAARKKYMQELNQQAKKDEHHKALHAGQSPLLRPVGLCLHDVDIEALHQKHCTSASYHPPVLKVLS